MKLYCDNGDGKLVELDTVKIIGAGDIVIRVSSIFHEDCLTEMEKNLSKKFERKVIILDARYGEILVIPPEKEPDGAPRRP